MLALVFLLIFPPRYLLGAPELIVGATLGPTAADKNHTDDDEGDDSSQLDEAGPELLLSISQSSEAADEDESAEEDGHKNSRTDTSL